MILLWALVGLLCCGGAFLLGVYAGKEAEREAYGSLMFSRQTDRR